MILENRKLLELYNFMASVLAQVFLLYVSIVHQPLNVPILLFFPALHHKGSIEMNSTELMSLNGTHSKILTFIDTNILHVLISQ